jgi:tRNA-2-methylthio-N6-dimethylallyladenosine synthase
MKFFLQTYGCQMNVRDSEVICGLLRTMNYELTTNPADADVIIFNTCSVRQHAEDKVWSEIGRYAKSQGRKVAGAREHRSADSQVKPIIGVVGCMAQNYQDQIFKRAPEVDFVVGPSDIDKIPGIIDKFTSKNLYEAKIWETGGAGRPDEIYHAGFYEDKNHAYVVVSEGCSNFCSYCVVPYVRGPLRNRACQDILREIEEAVSSGITRVTLLGQNVNAYNYQDVSFVKLVKLVNSIKGLKEFSFVTSHPKDTNDDLFKAMAECEKLKKCLHLPVQSGSDRVLKLMNRGYDKRFYLDLALNYRRIVKDALLTTDIIVGFPSEAEDDFEQTRELVERIGFDSAYIFKYSTRSRTEAARFPDDVLRSEKERRHRIILDLQKEISKGRKRPSAAAF